MPRFLMYRVLNGESRVYSSRALVTIYSTGRRRSLWADGGVRSRRGPGSGAGGPAGP